jgi:hypothetical protein
MIDEERVRRRAHEIWEREGRPEGRHDQHWQQAKDELAVEDGESLSVAGEEDPEPSILPPVGMLRK